MTNFIVFLKGMYFECVIQLLMSNTSTTYANLMNTIFIASYNNNCYSRLR